jgi:hypothetical protein
METKTFYQWRARAFCQACNKETYSTLGQLENKKPEQTASVCHVCHGPTDLVVLDQVEPYVWHGDSEIVREWEKKK